MRFHGAVAAVCLSVAPCMVAAQRLSVLPDSYVQLINNEVSGDQTFEHVRFTTQFHKPGGGSNGLWAIAAYTEQKAREYGLEDVKLIKQPFPGANKPWNSRFADLWIVDPVPQRLASTLQTQLHLADRSRKADVTAELIDVGAGNKESDYQGKDVAGKIVFAHGSIASVMREAVINRAALGIVVFPDATRPENFSYPDQVHWEGIGGQPANGREPTFAFNLSVRQGMALRRQLAAAKTPVRVHAIVDSELTSEQGDEPWLVMVEAYIHGTDPSLGQDIMLTGHMQEEKFSANDDGSGAMSTLEVARALNRLIKEGRLPRPRRNIRFWWTTEMQSERQYFADHPDEPRRIWVDINQDMVGANQSQDVLRTQNVTRLPATRFHFMNDVMEAVMEYLVAANSSELAAELAGTPDPNPRGYYSHLGTRHLYNAKTVFYHNNTDHLTFNETPIGVPGITFTNWPDNYIHSTDDDLWNIDRTQLGRNGVAAALIAYTMARADAADTKVLGAETAGRGAERLARNLRLGLSWILTAENKTTAYHNAVQQVQYAADRERRVLATLSEISPASGALVPTLEQGVTDRETEAYRELERTYRVATGQKALPKIALSATENQLAALRPALIAGPKEFWPQRAAVQRPGIQGLHSIMSWESLNAVNGQRTGLDIYRLVSSEAREAGEHYYGVVTPEAVLKYLQYVDGLKLIRLRPETAAAQH
jgi:hypothetical protein